MNDRRSRGLLTAWVLIGVLLYGAEPFLALHPLFLFFGFFLFLAMLAHTILGLVVLVVLVLRHHRQWRVAWPLMLAPVAVFAAFPGLNAAAGWAVSYGQFQIRRADYEAVIARVERGERPFTSVRGRIYPQSGGLDYRVEEGTPLRVAFPTGGGLADNWAGVVYDPTGLARTARGWRDGKAGQYTVAPEAREWFGGDIVSCRHIVDHYYNCSFT
jgi:hypothetical protein